MSSPPRVPIKSIVNALNIIQAASSRRAFFFEEAQIVEKTYKELTAYVLEVRPSALNPKTEPSASESQVELEFDFVEVLEPDNVIQFPEVVIPVTDPSPKSAA